MKKYIILLSTFVLTISLSAQVVVTSVKGDVTVRRGVANEWLPARVGDVLKPDDSMKSGERSSATITIDGKKSILIPEKVILDIGDLRQLDRNDLVLKLAMERVRAAPDSGYHDQMVIPQTTIVHGEKKEGREESVPAEQQSGLLQLNGTGVLFGHGYYGTCVLRTKEIFRLYPQFARRIDARLRIASALEKVNLYGEALTEYQALSHEELSHRDKIFVNAKIEQLKNRSNSSVRDEKSARGSQ